MKQINLGGGTVALDLPDEWEISDQRFMDATVIFPGYPAVSLLVSVKCYEHPESAACDDVSFFVFEEGMPFTEDSGVAPETLFVYGLLPADSDVYVQVYKLGHILPPAHIRILVARLELSSVETTERIPDVLLQQVREMVETSRFSNELTPLDQIALAEGMQRVQVDDCIFLRVPAGWHRGETEEGRQYCDTQDSLDGTLWIDWDIFQDFSATAAPSARDKAVEFTEIIRKLGNLDIVIDGDDDRAWLWSVKRGGDDNLAIFYGRLFVADQEKFAVVHFALVLTDSEAETPLAMACRATVEREVRKAVVVLDRF